MSVSVSSFIVVACYVLLLSFRVPIGAHRHVSFGGAFAPLIALLGPAHGRPFLLLMAAISGALVGLALKRSTGDLALEVIALLASFGSVFALTMTADHGVAANPLFEVAVGAVGVSVFALVERLGHRTTRRDWSREDDRVWLVLQALLLSACGLAVLVYEQIGAIALAAILVPLVLTKREFDRYAMAKATHDQTVRVLKRLEPGSL